MSQHTTERQLSGLDHLLVSADRALRTLTSDTRPALRASPALQAAECSLTKDEKALSIGLMRVNHTGEVCAQALYQGQALTAKLPSVRAEMERAADEEIDHLAWCEERVRQLGGHLSVLNPLWYAMSFGLGAAAGLVSDKVSLGFVSAIEDQVCEHLEEHLQTLPPLDEKSRAIVEAMLEDEAQHSHAALAAGGTQFPSPVKKGMTLVSRLMTKTSRYL
ncbi:MAG: 2-polyprenyl-3-methyl-6-methoxy-1,4-benzoquinone monooxygenase [Pseudomonadales bacterium]